jgi:hypothetical protein
MTLQEIERKVLSLHNRLNMRTTVEEAANIGELLAEARKLLQYGQWLPWLKRVGMGARTAQIYLQVFHGVQCEGNSHSFMTISNFIYFLREGRRVHTREQRREARRLAMSEYGPGKYKVVTADCRRYKWPAQVDHLVSDPPWRDMAAYRWLGKFARRRLRPGGLCIVQCGNPYLMEVASYMHGLTYVWTLAIVLEHPRVFASWCFAPSWRPVLAFSKGKPRMGRKLCDTHMVRSSGEYGKGYHPWQQPVPPFRYWLETLVRPGELVADPFAGAASIGVALKQIGARRYLGTEKDPDTAAVARGRLAEVEEGQEQDVSS